MKRVLSLSLYLTLCVYNDYEDIFQAKIDLMHSRDAYSHNTIDEHLLFTVIVYNTLYLPSQ